MKLLFLAPSFDTSNGWGRYASGFLREAKRRFGGESVVTPSPAILTSKNPRWKTIFQAVTDRNALLEKASSVNLIHATSETLAPLAMLLSIKTGKPYLISAHGTYADMRTYRWYSRWIYMRAFSTAKVIIPVSSYTELLVKKQFPEARTVVIPGGFDIPDPSSDEKRTEGFRILSVGALKPRKGFHTLIGAIASGIGVDVRVDIVGDDSMTSYLERLKAMIRAHGLEERVILHGRVAREDLERLYRHADLFALPSEHDGTAFEGLGLVYLEALARGVPVIGSQDSGAEDIIKDGRNGFLVEPGDVKGLAESMRRFFSERGLRIRMRREAERSVEPFRWEFVGKKMCELYASCLT